MVEEYYIGQILNIPYPVSAADWCDDNNAYLKNYGSKQVIISEVEKYVPTQEEIDNLTMTALDFINFLRGCGLSLTDIKTYLSMNEELDTQLTYCQNVYCGIAKAIMPISYKGITITAEMVEHAFRIKNGV